MEKYQHETVISGIIIDNKTTVTIVEICQHYHIEKTLVFEMIEHGIIEPINSASDEMLLDVFAQKRLRSALRLREDLEINLPGIALALELLDELESAHNELTVLRKQQL